MAKKITRASTGSVFFDYKDVKTLQRFVNQYGQIEVRKRTGLTEMQQRRLAKAIKRARHIALLPFVANNQSTISLSIGTTGVIFLSAGDSGGGSPVVCLGRTLVPLIIRDSTAALYAPEPVSELETNDLNDSNQLAVSLTLQSRLCAIS